MQGPPSQRLKLLKTVQDVAGLVLGIGSHVQKFPDVPVPYSEREDFDSIIAQVFSFRSGVPAIGEAVCHKEDGLLRVSPRRAQDFLRKRKKEFTLLK